MKVKINNKQQSREKIIALNLNRVPEIFVHKSDKSSMKRFFNLYKEEIYIVRDAERSSSKYYYVKNADECYNMAQYFSGQVIVAVSINAYKNKVLLGAIEIVGECIRICATTKEELDHRTMYNGQAEYNFQTNIFDKKLSDIPEFDFLYQYIIENNLGGYTIEFTIYDKPAGINKEKIIINEIRNY